MSYADSADLLAKFLFYSGLPATRESPSTAEIYDLLTQAQKKWTRVFAHQVPRTLWSSSTAMVTADGGVTYTFTGVTEVVWIGDLRAGLRGPIITQDNYVVEGATVRWPYGSVHTFAMGLYGRYVAPSGTLDGTNAPTFQPADARLILVYDALKRWASQGGFRDPAYYQAMLQVELYGDPLVPSDIGLLGALRLQHVENDAELAEGAGDDAAWWRASADL